MLPSIRGKRTFLYPLRAYHYRCQVFSSARIEQTTARIEDTSHHVVNTTLCVEQLLLVNHVKNQVKLKRLEGLMSQVLLEAQFGQGVTKGTMEKLKSVSLLLTQLGTVRKL